jgi:hypothetical protein
MASNENDKCKMEEEAKSLTARKRLWHTNDNGGDNDSSNSSDSPDEESLEEELEEEEEEMEEEEGEEGETKEEVPSEETSMNQLDTSEKKLYGRHAHGYLFGNDGDTPLMLPDTPPTPKVHRRSNEQSSDDDDDFWM